MEFGGADVNEKVGAFCEGWPYGEALDVPDVFVPNAEVVEFGAFPNAEVVPVDPNGELFAGACPNGDDVAAVLPKADC